MNKLIQQAFTLIELLVVIAIIGILSGLIVVSMSGVTSKATIAKAQVFSNSVKNSLMADIISEWKMEEGSGQSIIDSWNNANTGNLGSTTSTDTNDPTWTTSGCVYGGCLSFDGANDYAYFQDSSNIFGVNPEQWSYGVWAKSNNSSGKREVINDYDSDSTDYTVGVWLMQYNGTWQCDLRGTDGPNYVNSNVAVDNNWHYLFVSINRTGGNLKFYIDGQLINNITFSGTTSDYFDGGILRLGSLRAGSIGEFWSGLIDEARLYSGYVSSFKIKEQYYIGLNSLLINGSITKEDYLSKLNDYAAK